MNISATNIPGVLLLAPRAFPDERGWFFESHNERTFAEAGIATRWVQDNVSRSRRGVLRGLHFQNPSPQAKLVGCVLGEVWDVVVDLRVGSPTFGQWQAFTLDETTHHQLYVPVGLAHGFCVLSEVAIVTYKCSDFWAPAAEQGIAWDDPDLAIPWPVEAPTLSPKDARFPKLRDLPRASLFPFART